MIDHGGHACLADFSLLTMASDQSSIISSCIEGGTFHWMSPELLNPGMFGLEKICLTKESDCYALGMVVFEVLSGQIPFAPSMASVVISKVLGGERPRRPQGEDGILFTDSVWRVLELCWKPQPCDRINANTILQGLEGIPTTPNINESVETDAVNSLNTTACDSSMFSLCSIPCSSLIISHDNRIPNYTQ